VVAAASFVAASASAQTINVNFYNTSGTVTPAVPSTLYGVLGANGGLGTTWNQTNVDSGASLKDSTGATTGVGYVLAGYGNGWVWGTPALTVLTAGRANFTVPSSHVFTITGLVAGAKYDVWIASANCLTSQQSAGTWATTNATSSPSSQFVSNVGAVNGSTWQLGNNYALFLDVVADGAGKIIFTAQDGMVGSTSYRFPLSGFQIMPSPPREPIEFTRIVHDPASDQTTLTWKSNPGQNYGLYWAEDLTNLLPGVNPAINPAIPANASTNRTTFGPFASPRPAAKHLFYRLGPADLVNPVLTKVWGNGTNIALNFSEAMFAPAATNRSNFSVTKNGATPVAFAGVSLSPDGKTVTLTFAAPLDLGTPYSVTMNNLMDLSGRSLGNPTTGGFKTYDNNPNGVKVFILAGQSNMVGHGKGEEGVGGVTGAIGSLRYMAINYPAEYGRLLADSNSPTTSAWATRSDVKVWWRYSDVTATRAVEKGNLGLGYAEGQGGNPTWFGPEYAFGWVLGDYYTNPVLIIKTAWGGKSLNIDFRPPSAVAKRGGVVGPYYTGIIDDVRDVLSNLGTEFPEFAGMGYQIIGFAWHQGYNDRIDATASAAYEANLVDLIYDLRAEFGRPNLPITIATTGMAITGPYSLVESAQLAVADPAKHPEFAGTVFTTDTRPFWRDASVSPSNFGYHWNHNGETHYLIGKGMGQGMTNMLSPP
jgi:alpha-galactosidase